MMRGRVAYAGAIHEAYPDANGVRLADGRVRREDEVVWLAPIEVGTIFALGLNYAEHAKELQFNKQEEPLVFLKGPGTVIGHRGFTRAGGRDRANRAERQARKRHAACGRLHDR
jgi:5-oxopent-3-ene-1,2,5-tricarboxylate decarboxylase/2-hydroxyhepta-2,4-diene-1,7-dioate isomerase